MTIQDCQLIHELIAQDEPIKAANEIFGILKQKVVIRDKAAALNVQRDLLQGLLDNDRYLEAAVLQWGPNIFQAEPESVVREFEAMKKGSMILFMGASSMGKSLHPDTKVLMYSGEVKRAQDVMVGDQLMGDDSKPRNVLTRHDSYGPLYKIIPERGDPWTCNDAHILTLRCSTTKICGNSHQPSKCTVKGMVNDIPIKDYLAMPASRKAILKQFHVGVHFPHKEIPFDPYIYGSWIGDGGTDVPALHTPDGPMAKRWVEYFESIGYRIHVGYQDKCPMWCARVKENGCGGGNPNPFLDFIRTSVNDKEKFIRQDYLVNNRKNRLLLLAGLIDSDGWVSNKSSYGFISKFRNLAEQVKWLARSLGLAATIYPKKAKIKSIGFEGIYWNVQISGYRITDIPTREKSARESTSNKVLTNTGFSVEPAGQGRYCSFFIDGNHRFLLGDFTVTHNTYGVGAWMLLDYLRDPLYTSIKLGAVNEDHLRKNLFSHVVSLFRGCTIPCKYDIQVRDSDLWMGIKEAGNEFGVSGIAFKQSQDTSGQFKGYKAKPVRKKRHPKFGYMGRLRVLGDEGQNWPGGPFKDFNSLIASISGPDLVKIAMAFNPESVSCHVVQLAEPPDGWTVDGMETMYNWESKAGWHVCRLDAARSENVIQKKIIYPGLQTYEGYMSYLKSGGDNSANYSCVDSETTLLSWRGWIGNNEIQLGDLIYTVNPISGFCEWAPVVGVFKGQASGDMVSMEGRGFSALVTKDHRWALTHKQRVESGKNNLTFKTTQELKPFDLIPLARECSDWPSKSRYSYDFASLIGWVVTDGTLNPYRKTIIYQSQTANARKCEIIRNLLNRMEVKFSERMSCEGVVEFGFSGDVSDQVRSVLGDKKILTYEFINLLGRDELYGLMDAMLLGDGGYMGYYKERPMGSRYFCQKEDHLTDVFCAIAGKLGYCTTTHKRWVPNGKFLRNRGFNHDGTWMNYVTLRKSKNTRTQNIKITPSGYTGLIWCPTTKNGTFLARRKGTTYFTGNCFARGWPPMKGSVNTIIPPSWPQDARGEATFIETPIDLAAVDLAFMGKDAAQMAVGRWGLASGYRDQQGVFHKFKDRLDIAKDKPRHVLQLDQLLPMQKHDNAVTMAEEIIGRCKMLRVKPENCAIDTTGIGFGTGSHLSKVWGDVFLISWNEGATERKILAEDNEGADKQVHGVMSEMWWALRRWIDPSCRAFLINPIVPSNPIHTQFTSRRYEPGKNGIQVESKDKYKARNQHSPDEADAIVMLIHLVRHVSDVIPGLVEQTQPSKDIKGVSSNIKWISVKNMKDTDEPDSISSDGEDEKESVGVSTYQREKYET